MTLGTVLRSSLIAAISIIYLNSAKAQNIPEFGDNEKGLIYSDSTMQKLKHIVDSLDLKFLKCDLNKEYLSMKQGTVHYFSLEKKDLKNLENDLKRNMNFDSLCSKYRRLKVERDLPVLIYLYDETEKDGRTYEIRTPDLGKVSDHEFYVSETWLKKAGTLKGKYYFSVYEKTEYSDGDVSGFYFVEEPNVHALPEKYARMVQYSDCMVDTNASVFAKDAQRGEFGFWGNIQDENDTIPKLDPIEKWMSRVESFPGEPEYPESDSDSLYLIYLKEKDIWRQAKTRYVDSLLISNAEFKRMFDSAYAFASSNYVSGDDAFETYVGKYVSLAAALDLKRHRIVVGGCSMDQSPRNHAFNIAVLAAETVNWEIFLRSHLDIMNDNVSRVSDGSWAWQHRQTYIKELEALDINVNDLLLGIALRVDNPAENHYFGDVNRIGRAFAESSNPDEIENAVLSAMSDQQLDIYNRLIMYYIFRHYNYNLNDEARQKINVNKLQLAINTFPGSLSRNMISANK